VFSSDVEQSKGCVSFLPLAEDVSLTLTQYQAEGDTLIAGIKADLLAGAS
jgi:hypothetical protein